MRVLWTKDLLPSLRAVFYQCQGICMPALFLPSESEVIHAS